MGIFNASVDVQRFKTSQHEGDPQNAVTLQGVEHFVALKVIEGQGSTSRVTAA